MNRVDSIDPLKDKRWDEFVRKHPLGWVAHLSGWKRVLETSFPHMKGHYFALVDPQSNEIKAGLPVFEVRSFLTGNRLVSIPFATLCDPLISGKEDLDPLIGEAIRLLEQKKSSFLEIKTMNAVPLIDHSGLSRHCFFKHNYLELDQGIQAIWDNFNHREKRNIKKAQKQNLSMKEARDERDVASFYKLYAATRKRLGLPAQPCLFFKTLWDEFSSAGYARILLASLDGEFMAGHFLLQFNDRTSAEAVGWDINYKDINSNHFLYWEGIEAAVYNNYKIYDFGRTSPSNQTLLDFKKRWGTKIIDLPSFYYPEFVDEKKIDREKAAMYRLTRVVCRKAPDFAYEFIGNMCYRHLG